MDLSKLDALIAEKWMEWKPYSFVGGRLEGWYCDGWPNGVRDIRNWQPSTNAAHAGEARRMAWRWSLIVVEGHNARTGIACTLTVSGEKFTGTCWLDEVNNDPSKAEALATCLAIEAAEVAGALPVEDQPCE